MARMGARMPSGNSGTGHRLLWPVQRGDGKRATSGWTDDKLRSSVPRRARSAGFTFVELMVVVTIIIILISMAIPIYNRSIIRAKESVLHSNLATLRQVIDNYTYDKQKAPQNLQDLVSEGYLLKVPIDPMTGSNQTWRLIMEDASQSVSQNEP